LIRGALAAAAALLVMTAASACGGKREASPRRVPIRASDPALRTIPPTALEKQDERTRQLLASRERALEDRLASGAARSDLAAAYGELGQAYQAFGLLETTVACYENAGRLDPQVFAWPYLLGRAEAELNRPEPALAAVERALALQPTNLPALMFRGDLQRTLGRLDEARASYEKALAVSPSSGAALSGLGQVALLAGDPARAVDHLEKALRAEPRADRIHYPLSVAYRKLGAIEKAERHLALRGRGEATVPDPLLDGVLELNPYTLAQRGAEALRGGRFARAVPLLRAASDAFPENIEVRLHLGAALALSGDQEGALAQYGEALRRQPDNPHAHYNLGTILRQIGRGEEALVHLRRAVELHPEYPEAQFNLAQTLRHLGRDAEAVGPLDALLRLDPTDLRARSTRARVLARLGRCPEAVRSLEEGLRMLPGRIPLTDTLARLLAACPPGQGRDARRAALLAQRVFAEQGSAEHAATVALAEGSRGGWAQAAAWQRRALGLLPAGAPPETRAALAEQLRSYERGSLPADW